MKFCYKECFERNAFFIQVIDILDGPEYDADRELDKAVLPKSLDRQDFLIKSLYIIYSYGLNKHETNLIILQLFAVCIFQSKGMCDEISGTGMDATLDGLVTIFLTIS